MILAGLLGMASKFTECTLGVKYKNEYPDGTVSGGPMYYISKGFDELGLPGSKILAVLFSVFCILGALGGGNMFQANQAHLQITQITGEYPGWITGVVFASVVFAVIVGGIKSIARVTEIVVPFMGIMYVGAALIVLLEPLIDTFVICTMTALVIIISQQLLIDQTTGNYIFNEAGSAIATVDGNSGVALTSAAFGSAIGWFPFCACNCILFAFSTMSSWSYYGLKAWTYLFGEGKTTELVFKVIFCIFVVIGAAASLGPVIDFSDAAIFAMAVVNIFCLYFLMKVVRTELISYSERLKSGEIKKFKH